MISTLSIEQDAHRSIVGITLSRPERRNALDAQLVAELTAAIRSHGEDPEVRVIVLSGAGTAFSAGADLEALARLQDSTFEDNLADSRVLAGLFDAILRCPVPVVARVHGPAIAGGCGLVAACDLAIASENATFGFTEVRIGFVPAIVSVILMRRIRGSVVRDLLLTGRTVSALDAHQAGLVTRVVPADELDEAVYDLAVQLARDTSREAVAATKKLLLEITGMEHGQALEHALLANASARGTDDCRAGVRAFLDRTLPPWKASW